MTVNRRRFLKVSGASLALIGTRWPVFGLSAPAPLGSGVLVVIFQRGAADALNMVAPYRDRRYREIRGDLALDEPGRGENPTFDLGSGFALHPALSPLYPLYRDQKLAAVVNVGSSDPTRSHFDAQDYMESGTPGRKSTPDGWLARMLEALPGEEGSAFTGVALSTQMPRSLAGARHAIALPDFAELERDRRKDPLLLELEALYDVAGPAFSEAGDEGFRALEAFRATDPLSRPPRAGVRYPEGRASLPFRQLAQLIKADLGVRIAFVESNGWDTHFAQGGATGQMSNLMRNLSAGLAAFVEDVGDERELSVLVVTEFGRTVAPNGAGGTDHGHGSVMFALGDGVHGGRVHGDWLGLESRNLYEGRDLPVTTDFRDVFGEAAARRLGGAPGAVDLFPGHRQRAVGIFEGG